MAPRREGRWLCPYCGEENLGRHKECVAGCGVGRPEGVRFYRPGNAPVITDPALLALAASGADWNCDHCGSANPNLSQGAPVSRCTQCGEPRTAEDTQTPVRHFALGQTPRTAADLEPPRTERRARPPAPIRRQPRSMARRLGAMMVAVVILALGASIFAPVRTDTGSISDLAWRRTVTIEKLVTERKKGWELPEAARVISSKTKIRDYEEVVDHYVDDTRPSTRTVLVGRTSEVCGEIDLGNGFFEDKMCPRDVTKEVPYDEPYKRPVMKKVPIKGTWYEYEIDRWVHARSPSSSGHGHQAVWPEVSLGAQEREVRRQASYQATLDFQKNRDDIRALSLEAYQALKVGDPVAASFTIWGTPKGVRLGALADRGL